jgi:acetyl-CoA acetyltransferase
VTDGIDRDLFRRIRDQVAIVGIGHLPFAKDIGRPISDTAVEAIQLALDDAGLEAEDVDGMSMLEMEATHEVSIARRLGVRQLTWWDKISYGGGGSAGMIGHAAAAIAAGMATTVVCHRARNRGSRTARPWTKEKTLVTDDKALHTPWGLIRPVDVIGMWAHRVFSAHQRPHLLLRESSPTTNVQYRCNRVPNATPPRDSVK